jgi:polyhydroxyalkanoate synthesis regulator phasin
MGILDKVKEVAGTAVEAGKKAADAAKEKVEDVQLRRKADNLARQLGYLVVANGVSAGEEGDALAAQIKELEAQIAADAEKPTEGGGEAEAAGE